MPIEVKAMSRTKPSGRSSSVTNAFFNGIIPYVKPTESDYEDIISKKLVELDKDKNYLCVYCGENKANSWDHIRPLIVDKRPSGYIHEISNLIPACSSCNSSKGNKWVDDFFETSKRLKKIPKDVLEERKKKVKTYMDYFENKYGVIKIPFEEFPKDLANEFEEYVKSLEEIHQKLKDATKKSDILHESLMEYINRNM
jgi:5-methylcytosine-specific restriction endonuclease McrA